MVAVDCKAPGNKTPKADEQFVHDHFKSCSVVESHNTRKDTNRKYLAPELNIKNNEMKNQGQRYLKIRIMQKTTNAYMYISLIWKSFCLFPAD